MHYYCQCLNVNINVLEIDQDSSKNVHSSDLIPFANLTEEWFRCHLISEKSIDIHWFSLIQSTIIREMELYRCLNCTQYTHIINHESNEILLNTELLNETTVKDRYEHLNYSKSSKIVLSNEWNSVAMTRSMGAQDDVVQRDCELAQQIYRQSIDQTEQETEEKIRIYQRDQEELLQKKIEKMNQELETVLHVIRSVSHQTATMKSSPTSIPYINENSMESGFGSDIFDANGIESSRPSSTIERTLFEQTDNPDEDPVFYNADWSIGIDNSPNLARSVPKNIAFRFHPIPKQQETIDNADLERIGKSFRELSQSLMCTDGTELFGDLPSPRINGK